MANSSHQMTVVVKNAHGLHLRPAELMARAAMQFEATVLITKEGQSADCKNMLAVLTLGAEQGTHLELSAQGADASEAVTAIAALFEQGFHEMEKPQTE